MGSVSSHRARVVGQRPAKGQLELFAFDDPISGPDSDDLECWLPVPDWPGYEVSDWGRLQSYRTAGGRTKERRGNIILSTPRIIGGYVDRHGYAGFCLYRNGGREKRRSRVHILVLEAFVGPRPRDMEACHRDGNPANNRLDNLYWGTRKSNKLDMMRHGNGPNKLTEDDVREICRRLLAGERMTAIARDHDVSPAVISAIKTGTTWGQVTKDIPGFPMVSTIRGAKGDPVYVPEEYANSPEEIWKPIPGYPAYRVSNLARLASCLERDGKRRVMGDTWKVLSGGRHPFGYTTYLLYTLDGRKRKTMLVHIAVLLAFAGPRPPGMVACHNDGDPTNNNAYNLRWDTQRSNVQDRFRHANAVSPVI